MDSIDPKDLKAVFWDWNKTIVDEDCRPYENSLRFIKSFGKLGLTQGIISNGNSVDIKIQLVQFQIDEFFKKSGKFLVVGAESTSLRKKPSADMYTYLTSLFNAPPPDKILYIGNSSSDYDMSINVGTKFCYIEELKLIKFD